VTPLSQPHVLLASASPQRLALLRAIGIEPLVAPSGYDERPVAGEGPEDMVRRLAQGKARSCLGRCAASFPSENITITNMPIADSRACKNITTTNMPNVAPAQHEAIASSHERRGEGTTAEPPPALLVAADTVVVIDNEVLGKPRDLGDAFAMLTRLRGREHRVLTGLVLAKLAVTESGRALLAGGPDVSLAETWVRFRNLDESEIRAYLEREDVLGAAGSYRVQGLGVLLLDSIRGSWSNIAGLPLEVFAARARLLGFPLL